MDLGLEGRCFIVTGGSSGLGFATARELAAEGAKVVLASRTAARVEKAAEHIGDAAVGCAVSLGQHNAAEQLWLAAQQHGGRCDGALLSVGGPPSGTAMQASDEEWRQAFEDVFLGTLRVARYLGEHCAAGSALAFVLSSSVKAPIANLAISNGLRPGLAMAAKTMADELGETDIRVNSLLPGRIDTDRVAELDASTGNAESARAEAIAGIPLNRYGKPEEFAKVAAFVLSPAASYVTGSAISVDGGLTRAL